MSLIKPQYSYNLPKTRNKLNPFPYLMSAAQRITHFLRNYHPIKAILPRFLMVLQLNIPTIASFFSSHTLAANSNTNFIIETQANNL